MSSALSPELRQLWLDGISAGSIVPCVGPGVLADVVSTRDGRRIPATSDELIIALNGGKPMSPKLMFEFSRAAMNIELKRGRNAIKRFLDTTYASDEWSRAATHDWLRALHPAYVIDINRDMQLLDSYAGIPHQVVLGCARLGGSAFRYLLYRNDGSGYVRIEPELGDPALPTLFKPLGAPLPGGVVKPDGTRIAESSYIASDADHVDFITELMGGFAVPAFLKRRREGLRYLLIGLRLQRDTERMVLAELFHGAASEPAGWALLPDASANERRFCTRLGLQIIDADFNELIGATTGVAENRQLA
ncbi:SIR2 family protein [Rhodocyclus tenuis]|uniref:SIR2 family protein n=1 Tax=Rhodocyclus tenuis TaxID=1066 RepID=A0A840GA52_RHOTE|nr:SIR2 family protein [Rhodocyclus tenuis]MBB4248726.1 hypothetical protein [Rhodocyclus tenuis]